MVSGQVMLVAVGFAALWWAGHKTIGGVKKVDHAIVNKLHHPKAANPTAPVAPKKP